MPDVQDFQLEADTDANVNSVRIRVRGKLVDSQTGVAIPNGDFTGANFILFALRVQGFTPQHHMEMANDLAVDIMYRKAGLK